jgi:hypothetical protein
MYRLFPTLGLLTCVFLTVGCGNREEEKPAADTAASSTAADDGGHSHGSGPHGGAVSDWGGGAYHVEFTVNHDEKQSTVYVLGSDGKTPAPVASSKISLRIDEPAFDMQLTAEPLDGEPAGTSSRFVGTHDNLGVVREFSGSITGEVDGTPYVGDFAETPE